MPINDPYALPSVRPVRWRVLSQGQPVGGALGIEAMAHSYFQANTFTASFALNADSNYGINWWGTGSEILLDLQSSINGGNSWDSLLFGQVDHMTASPETGEIRVEGRDLSARLIDTKTQNAYVNQTASQIAQTLAAKHGMTADVQATATLVGRYYGEEHDHITLNQFSHTTTEWDLLVNLAQFEQFDVWVSGTTLHFKPRPDPNSDPYDVIWRQGTPVWSNVANLSLERSLMMAKDVVVAVRSWSSRDAVGFTRYSPSGARQNSIASGKTQEFTYVIPNLTPAQAQDKANALREDITRNERLVTWERPSETALTERSMVRLSGTGSSWDQTYFVDWIRRRAAWDGGLVMTVHCKNHSPATSVGATP